MKRIRFENPLTSEDTMHLEVMVGRDEEGDPTWRNTQMSKSCDCNKPYCKHAWEALDEFAFSDEELYAMVNSATTNWHWDTDKMSWAKITTPPGVTIKMPDPLGIEKAALFDGEKWRVNPHGMRRIKYKDMPPATASGPVATDGTHVTWDVINHNKIIRTSFPTKEVGVRLSDESWYYPWGEPKQDVPETVLPPSCQHKWVDVGVMHPKIVCYHCDIEKEEEKHVTK